MDCPTDCPNRKKDTQTGKWAAYFVALCATGFLAFSCLSYERRGNPVPIEVWIGSLTIISGALGVNVDPARLGEILTKR